MCVIETWAKWINKYFIQSNALESVVSVRRSSGTTLPSWHVFCWGVDSVIAVRYPHLRTNEGTTTMLGCSVCWCSNWSGSGRIVFSFYVGNPLLYCQLKRTRRVVRTRPLCGMGAVQQFCYREHLGTVAVHRDDTFTQYIDGDVCFRQFGNLWIIKNRFLVNHWADLINRPVKLSLTVMERTSELLAWGLNVSLRAER